MMGVAASPATPPIREGAPLPPVALAGGEILAQGFNAWAGTGGLDSAIATQEYEGARRASKRGDVSHGLPARGEGEHRPHLLAGGAAARRELPDALPGA